MADIEDHKIQVYIWYCLKGTHLFLQNPNSMNLTVPQYNQVHTTVILTGCLRMIFLKVGMNTS
jgi:hypothetical protein